MEQSRLNPKATKFAILAFNLLVLAIFGIWLFAGGLEWIRDSENLRMMRGILAIISLVGALLLFVSLFFRSESAPPVGSPNPRDWVPVWRQQSHFREPGFLLMLIGLELFSGGALINSIAAILTW